MQPTLKPGRIVIGLVRYKRLQPGDIVIIAHGGLEKVKRVHQLQPGLIFVTGDNPAHSTDSRSLGWLPVSVVQAKLIWPRRTI